MRVAIVVVNWNGYQDTIECLKTLADLNYQDFDIYIADNNSSDNSPEKLVSWINSKKVNLHVLDESYLKATDKSYNILEKSKNIILCKFDNNYGFAGANNRAIQIAFNLSDGDLYEYIWLLNNDTEVCPDALTELIRTEQSCLEDKRALVGSKLVYFHNRSSIQAYGGCSYNKLTGVAKSIGNFDDYNESVNTEQIESQIDYIIGASMLVPVIFINDTGYLSEEYFLYYEEIDWCIRRDKSKFCLKYADKSIVYHKEGASIGSSSTPSRVSLLSEYFLFKNKLKFTRKYYWYFLPSVIFISLLQAINRLRRFEIEKFMNIINVLLGRTNVKFEQIKQSKVEVKVL